jgi:hypothetical protein
VACAWLEQCAEVVFNGSDRRDDELQGWRRPLLLKQPLAEVLGPAHCLSVFVTLLELDQTWCGRLTCMLVAMERLFSVLAIMICVKEHMFVLSQLMTADAGKTFGSIVTDLGSLLQLSDIPLGIVPAL